MFEYKNDARQFIPIRFDTDLSFAELRSRYGTKTL